MEPTEQSRWQTEILGDRAAMRDALTPVVSESFLDRAVDTVIARLAADRNGSRILIRAAEYGRLERVEEELAALKEAAVHG